MTLDIVDRIEMDLLKGELQLPVMPSIAAKINATADDPEQGINDLAKLIHSDVALTAHVIQTSNSAFYRGNVQNKTLIQSLNRLGMEGTRILAMGYCVKAMYASSNGKKPHPMLQRQWQSSTRLAALCSVLASKVGGFDVNVALLAGLLQDIGALPLITRLSDEFTDDTEEMSKIVNKFTRRTSVELLKQWKFDKELIEVAKARGQWQREHKGEFDLADLVTIARLHLYIGTPLMKKLPKINAIPAFNKLPMQELTPSDSLKIIAEAKDLVDEVQKNLT